MTNQKTLGQTLYEHRFPDDSVPWNTLGRPAQDEWEGMAGAVEHTVIARLAQEIPRHLPHGPNNASCPREDTLRSPCTCTEHALRAALTVTRGETAQAWKACRDTASIADEKIRDLKKDYEELRLMLGAEREALAALKKAARDHLDTLDSIGNMLSNDDMDEEEAFEAVGQVIVASPLRAALEKV